MGQDLFAANGDKNSVGQVVIRLRLIDVGSTTVKISSFSYYKYIIKRNVSQA